MQVIVALREDLSLKREASIELSRKSISVTLSGVAVLCGDLAHDVDGEGSDWLVEDELPGFDGARFLVFDLRKRESFVDWPAPLAADCGGGGTDRTLLIGGKGEAQKRATARQCATARPTPRRTALCSAAAADAPTNPCPPNPAAPPPPPVPPPPPPRNRFLTFVAGSPRTRSCRSCPPTCAATSMPVRRAASQGWSRRRSAR